MKLAFIGTGNMGGAIIRAVCSAADPQSVTVTNRTMAKAEAVAAACGCKTAATNAACAQGSDYIFLGVKPNMIREVLRGIAPVLSDRQVIVSMAAGVTGEAMREALTEANAQLREIAIVRILPNTPSEIGCGLVLTAPGKNADEAALEAVEAILAGCGMVGRSDDEHAEAAMTVGGCTPAFTYMFIEALADGGVVSGVPRKQAIRLAAAAVQGAAALVLETGKHPEQLKDEVCSPAGTTIEGVKALEENGFRNAAFSAVLHAVEKGK